MPLYEYRCTACSDQIEVMQKFSDPLLTTCEKCGGSLKKLVSNSSFVLKGSGWYVTDYARKGRGGSEGPSESKSSSNSKTESKTESKSDNSSSAESSSAKPSSDTKSAGASASPNP